MDPDLICQVATTKKKSRKKKLDKQDFRNRNFICRISSRSTNKISGLSRNITPIFILLWYFL